MSTAAGYVIQWKLASQRSYLLDNRASVAAGSVTYRTFTHPTTDETLSFPTHRVTGLQPNTKYDAKVTVYTAAGTADRPDGLSDENFGTTHGELTGLTVDAVDGETTKLDVSWAAPVTTVARFQADGYRVQWKTGSGKYPDANVATVSTVTSHRITGLAAGTAYTVRVTVMGNWSKIRADGDAAEASGTTNSQVQGAAAPAQPEPPQGVGSAGLTGLAVAPVSGETTQLAVSWGAVENAAKYGVRWKTGSGDYGDAVETTGNSYTITNLSANTSYTVNVAAIDGDNALLEEGTASGATLAAMGTVSVDAVTDSSDSLVVSWPSVNGAVGYRVEWKTGGGTYDDVARPDATATSERITGLEAETEYTVRVTARHTIGGAAADGDSAEGSGTTNAAAPVNTPASGAPTISGTAQVGETLTADTSGITDADGLDNASFSYQWLADGSDISGATESNYTPVSGDVGKAVSVRVSFTDDADNAESLTSAATAAVIAANTPASGAPSISGTVQVGKTLTASTSGITDADGLDNASFSYQWLADGSAISGATGSTYTPVDGDLTKAITVRVSFTDDAGNAEMLTSAAATGFVIYHDPNAGDAAVDRYNQGVKALKDASISYSEVTGDVQDDVDRLAGVTGSVLPRFFLGDPTAEGWVSETKVNNGGLRWLKKKVAELSGN